MTTSAHVPGITPGFAPHLWLLMAGTAVVLGLFADTLFSGVAPGINVPVWVAALIGAFALSARLSHRRIGKMSASLLAASLGLAAMIA